MSQLWTSYEQESGVTGQETEQTSLRFYSELFVEHSPSAVWSFFSDLTKWTSWSPICRGCRLSDQGELQSGSVLEIHFRVLGLTLSVPAVVVQFNPPTSITWQGQKFGVHATHTYRFIPHQDGTLLCNEETFRGVSSPTIKLMTAWYRASQLSHQSLQGLKRELASNHGS